MMAELCDSCVRPRECVRDFEIKSKWKICTCCFYVQKKALA